MKSDLLFNRCYKISRVGAIFSIVLGLLVVIIWVFNIQTIQGVLPNWATMQPTTAVGFILLGFCIILTQSNKQRRGSTTFFISLISIFIIVFSGITLMEYLINVNFGIEQWFLKDHQYGRLLYSIRMSFITATNFILSSLAILYLNLIKRRSSWPAHILALIVFLISLDAFFGFTYGIKSFFDDINDMQLSLHASVFFVVTSVAILFLDPRSGFTKIFILDSMGARLAWKLLPSMLILPPLIGLVALGGEELNLYDSEFRIIVVVMSFFIIFTTLVWRTAYSMHIYEKQYRILNKRLWKIHLTNQELIDTKQHLEEVTSRDELTGLANRSHFHGLLEHAMLRAKRYKSLVGLFFIDIDNFKQINDNFGHEVGDKLLVSFANRLKNLLREIDSIARLGGDEFTVIIEDPVGIENINIVAKRIIDSLVVPFVIMDNVLVVTVSIGISTFPKDGKDVNTLIKNADIAMYQAKRTGKNKHQFYEEDYSL